MVDSLNKTKLFVPPARQNLVNRYRLIRLLEEGYLQGCRLSLICAPAGYGKSMLAAQWLNQLKDEADSKAEVCWLSLDRNDNDLVRFLSYLIATLGIDNSDFSTYRAIRLPLLPATDILVSNLINDISKAPNHNRVLVLDDYQRIHLPQIHQTIEILIDHGPASLHLVMITREDPPLALSRMRVQGELTEVRAKNLRFTQEETGLFLKEIMKLNLEPQWIKTLETRTEGWIAGLQLAALSIRGREDIAGFLEKFRGSHRYVMDYLMDEVLMLQSEDIRKFLFQTSMLERFNADLCEAITGREDSREVLLYIEQSNLFLIPLDNQLNWYRYHHMFADFLRTALSSGEQIDVLKKASAWFQKKGLSTYAVEYALATGDYELASDNIKLALSIPHTWSSGNLSMLENWLNILPGACMRSRPELQVRASRVLYLSGKINQASNLLDQVEQILKSELVNAKDRQVLEAQVYVYRAAIAAMNGNIHEAEALIKKNMANIHKEDLHTQARAYDALGLIYEQAGSLDEAIKAYLKTSDVALSAGVLYLAINALCEVAMLQITKGQLTKAKATCEEALKIAGQEKNSIPPIGLAWAVMGEIKRRQNELPLSEEYLLKGIDISQNGGIIDDIRHELVFLFNFKLSQKNWGSALDTLEQAELILQSYNIPRLSLFSSAMRVRLYLKRGDIEEASYWARQYEYGITSDSVEYLMEYEKITLAKVKLAEACFNEAAQILKKIMTAARTAGRLGTLKEALILYAITTRCQHLHNEAAATLKEALALARPEEDIRIFIDEGDKLQILFSEYENQIRDPLLNPFISRICLALMSTQRQKPKDSLEQLTIQEQRILQLLSAGLSNQEIANELVVTLGTVKWHVHNIYGKLEVGSRTQALVKAKVLGIL